MQNFTRRLSTTIVQPLEQFFSVPLSRTDSAKSAAPIRTHLNIPDEQSRRLSIDSSHRPAAPVPTIVTVANDKATTTVVQHSPSVTGDGQRTARFSSVSSSYAQFLKQRDMDKVKKIVSDVVEFCANLDSSRLQRSNETMAVFF